VEPSLTLPNTFGIPGEGIDRDALKRDRDAAEDRLYAEVATLLDEHWPNLEPYYRAVMLSRTGGFPKTRPPATYDVVAYSDENIYGDPITMHKIVDRTRLRRYSGDLDGFPPLEQTSRELVLGLIRAFRDAGGPGETNEERARQIMGQPVKATEWIHDLGDRFDEEFGRCWIKAGIHPRHFHEPGPRKAWVSHDSDQSRVFSLIEIMADAGEPLWMRAVRTSGVLDGKRTEGRITKAVEALIERGLVTKIDRGKGKRALLFPIPLAPVPEPPAVEPEPEPDPEQAARLDAMFEAIDLEKFLSGAELGIDIEDEEPEPAPRRTFPAAYARRRYRSPICDDENEFP
jgi:hypothetical protein